MVDEAAKIIVHLICIGCFVQLGRWCGELRPADRALHQREDRAVVVAQWLIFGAAGIIALALIRSLR